MVIEDKQNISSPLVPSRIATTLTHGEKKLYTQLKVLREDFHPVWCNFVLDFEETGIAQAWTSSGCAPSTRFKSSIASRVTHSTTTANIGPHCLEETVLPLKKVNLCQATKVYLRLSKTTASRKHLQSQHPQVPHFLVGCFVLDRNPVVGYLRCMWESEKTGRVKDGTRLWYVPPKSVSPLAELLLRLPQRIEAQRWQCPCSTG